MFFSFSVYIYPNLLYAPIYYQVIRNSEELASISEFAIAEKT